MRKVYTLVEISRAYIKDVYFKLNYTETLKQT